MMTIFGKQQRRWTAILALASLTSTAGYTQDHAPDQATGLTPPPGSAWLSELHTDHPLAGQIWLSSEARFIHNDELLQRLADADVLLLGEKHDNPDHHRLRLDILRSLLTADSADLLVLEMLTQAQQTGLDALADSNPLPAADQWPTQLDWDMAWHWEFYRPALELGLETGTRLQAGNISTDTMMAIYRAENSPSDSAPGQILNTEQLAQLSEEIDLSHCGMLPASQIPAMVRVQQARDQQMADALMTAGTFEQRILLAGNYHVRNDLGVPNYLPAAAGQQADAAADVVNLAFLEVDPAVTDPQAYQPGDLAYDLIWFTPAVRADDYCADLSASQ